MTQAPYVGRGYELHETRVWPWPQAVVAGGREE